MTTILARLALDHLSTQSAILDTDRDDLMAIVDDIYGAQYLMNDLCGHVGMIPEIRCFQNTMKCVDEMLAGGMFVVQCNQEDDNVSECTYDAEDYEIDVAEPDPRDDERAYSIKPLIRRYEESERAIAAESERAIAAESERAIAAESERKEQGKDAEIKVVETKEEIAKAKEFETAVSEKIDVIHNTTRNPNLRGEEKVMAQFSVVDDLFRYITEPDTYAYLTTNELFRRKSSKCGLSFLQILIRKSQDLIEQFATLYDNLRKYTRVSPDFRRKKNETIAFIKQVQNSLGKVYQENPREPEILDYVVNAVDLSRVANKCRS
jgi:hypothetical protein